MEGQARAVSEGKTYEMKPGDCLATGMGHHHDMPLVHEPVQGVYFETTLEGQKRRGHLWDQFSARVSRNSLAEPQAERGGSRLLLPLVVISPSLPPSGCRIPVVMGSSGVA